MPRLPMEIVRAHKEAYIAERARKVEETIARIPLETRETWAALTKQQKQAVFVWLLFHGLPTNRAAELLGMAQFSWRNWYSRERDHMKRLTNEGFSEMALLEMPESIRVLIELRDYSENEETRRKSTLDLLRAAGHGIDSPAPSQLTVNMNGEQNQFNVMTTRELDDKIDQLGKSLGPQALKIIEEERRGNSARGLAGPSPGTPTPPPAGPT